MTHQQIASKAWQQTDRPHTDRTQPVTSRSAESPLPESVREHPRIQALEEAIAAITQLLQTTEQDLAATKQELLTREQTPAFHKARALFGAGWRVECFARRGRAATFEYHLCQEGTQTDEFYLFRRGLPTQGADLFARLEIASEADREQALAYLVILTTEAHTWYPTTFPSISSHKLFGDVERVPHSIVLPGGNPKPE